MKPHDFDALIPFPHKASPYLDRVRDDHLAWMREHGLVPHDAASKVYRTWHIPELAAYHYPEATGEGLRLGMDLMGWIFPFDDIFDGPLSHEPRQTSDMIEIMTAILHSPPGAVPGVLTPVTTGFGDIWSRSVASMSSAWRARATANWTDYFNSYAKECSIRAGGTALTLDDFFKLRRDTSAVASAVDLNEVATGYEVPDRAWRSHHLRTMLQITTDGATLVNDAFSAEKEEAAGEMFNTILLAQRNTRCSRSEAMAEIAHLLSDRVQQFLRMEQQVPAVLDELELTGAERDATNRCVGHLRQWFRGEFDWSMRSGRYKHGAILPDTNPGAMRGSW